MLLEGPLQHRWKGDDKGGLGQTCEQNSWRAAERCTSFKRRRFRGHKFDYTGSGISTELTKAEQRARVRDLFVKVHRDRRQRACGIWGGLA